MATSTKNTRAASKMKRFETTPWWPTQIEKRYDNMIMGTDNKVWLTGVVPLGPVSDAVNSQSMLDVGEPLMEVMEEVSSLSGAIRTNRRKFDKGAYRNIHILLVNIPDLFRPPMEHPNAAYLDEMYQRPGTFRRLLFFSVELRAQTGGGNDGIKGIIDSVTHTLLEGGTPISDYDKDRLAVSAAFGRANVRPPTAEEFRIANSWWNRGSHPDVPYLPHGDHLHFFQSADAADTADRLQKAGTPCKEWDRISGEHTIAFSTVEQFSFPYIEATDYRARWAESLIQSNVVAISIRGALEPAKVTRAELRRHRKNYMDDVNERYAEGKMERAEQEEMLQELTNVESHYGSGGTDAPPTLMDMSITVATSGRHPRYGFDPTEMGENAGLVMDGMMYRQEMAFVDTMLGSPVRANPHLHDLPITAVAYSGLPSLSTVGDKPAGALVGFTERDRQPAWMDQMAAVNEDSMPICLVVGQSGSGKSVLMQWLADQYARTRNDRGERTPVIMIDLKMSSDFTPSVEASGGKVYSLDQLLSSDGVFDPMRFSSSPEAAIDMSHSLLMSINPFGSKKEDYETPLRSALQYGMEHGATCSGQAIEIAARDKISPEVGDILKKIKDAATPMFRALCGFDPNGEGLRAAGGTTYIRIGDMDLNLPEGIPASEQNLIQRVTLALVRAMVYGSIHALANRQGVVLFDEGWIFLSAGKAEMERVGRLARSQQVYPIIFTQRTQDALKAELEGYISRGIILPIQDEKEAAAGLTLFKLEVTPARMSRITAKPTLGGTDEEGAPNWNSFRALRDPRTKKVLRGTIGLYVDLSGKAVPVEIWIPSRFLTLASTNREDIMNRNAAKLVREAKQAEAVAAGTLNLEKNPEIPQFSGVGSAHPAPEEPAFEDGW